VNVDGPSGAKARPSITMPTRQVKPLALPFRPGPLADGKNQDA